MTTPAGPQRKEILTLTVLDSKALACVPAKMSQTGLEHLALQPATALYEARLKAVSAQEDVLGQSVVLESGMLLACMLLRPVCCFTA